MYPGTIEEWILYYKSLLTGARKYLGLPNRQFYYDSVVDNLEKSLLDDIAGCDDDAGKFWENLDLLEDMKMRTKNWSK